MTYQALLPANSGVTRAPGGRAAFESSSAKVPNGPATLKDGSSYETITGLGERAWAYGNAKQANVVVLKGADLYAVDSIVEGAAPTGSTTPTGMDAKSLEICQALARKALG